MLWTDMLSVAMAFVTVLLICMNCLGFFQWSLLDVHPHLAFHMCIMLGLRGLQLMLILHSRQLYLRYRVAFNVVIKLYNLIFLEPLVLYAGVHRKGFYGWDWLGGEDVSGGEGRVTADGAIYKALLLPTGATAIFFEIVQTMHMPFRYLLPLQALLTVAAIRQTWGPVSRLLEVHEKLSRDAAWICQATSEATSMVVGFGAATTGITTPRCGDGQANTRVVLMAQLIFVFLLPIFLAYAMECEAKRAWLCKLGINTFATSRGVYWSVYVGALLAGVAGCDHIVTLIHWLGVRPRASTGVYQY